jgi:hypothetical protein
MFNISSKYDLSGHAFSMSESPSTPAPTREQSGGVCWNRRIRRGNRAVRTGVSATARLSGIRN